MKTIRSIVAREILDSRGNPTVEADLVLTGGGFGRASVPSGASTGIHEATELRDNDSGRYDGKGVQKAVSVIRNIIAPAVTGRAFDQRTLDHALILLDGTEQKKKLGANSILAVSMAFAKAHATSDSLPLWKYFNTLSGGAEPSLPIPMMNILNGGKHAPGGTDIQEFMVMPRVGSFAERLRIGTEIFHALKSLLKKQKLSTLSGDEGGFAPALPKNEDALKLLTEAISVAGYTPGKEVGLAIDVAASSFFKDGKYELASENRTVSAHELVELYEKWAREFSLVSIEDGLEEDGWSDWKVLTEKLGSKATIVGDDLFVTNVKRLNRGIKEKSANSILVKLNQIGSVTETIDVVRAAHDAGFRAIISHRSGETEDATIAHLSVGLGTGFIKAGAPCHGERTAKYNELLRIEETLENV